MNLLNAISHSRRVCKFKMYFSILVAAIFLNVIFDRTVFGNGESIGTRFDLTSCSWSWGSDYIPSGVTPIKMTVEIHSSGYDCIAPKFPWCRTGLSGSDPLLPTNSRLIQVQRSGEAAESVSYDSEALSPSFQTNSSIFFTYEITPAQGYSWPSNEFRLDAGGRGVPNPEDGGFGATGAVMAPWYFKNPKLTYPYGSAVNSSWDRNDYINNGRWGDNYAIAGKDYTSSSCPPAYNQNQGMWVNAGDQIIVNCNDAIVCTPHWGYGSPSFGKSSSPIWVIDADGIEVGYESYRFLPDVPFMALVAAVIGPNGSYTPFESEKGPSGFVGNGTSILTAPVSGFVGLRQNGFPQGSLGNGEQDLWLVSQLDPANPMPDLDGKLDYTVTLVPEPTTLLLFSLARFVSRRKNFK